MYICVPLSAGKQVKGQSYTYVKNKNPQYFMDCRHFIFLITVIVSMLFANIYVEFNHLKKCHLQLTKIILQFLVFETDMYIKQKERKRNGDGL